MHELNKIRKSIIGTKIRIALSTQVILILTIQTHSDGYNLSLNSYTCQLAIK